MSNWVRNSVGLHGAAEDIARLYNAHMSVMEPERPDQLENLVSFKSIWDDIPVDETIDNGFNPDHMLPTFGFQFRAGHTSEQAHYWTKEGAPGAQNPYVWDGLFGPELHIQFCTKSIAAYQVVEHLAERYPALRLEFYAYEIVSPGARWWEARFENGVVTHYEEGDDAFGDHKALTEQEQAEREEADRDLESGNDFHQPTDEH